METELVRNWKEHSEFVQEITITKTDMSQSQEIINDEIESININSFKLKAAHEKLASEVEIQNWKNADSQGSGSKAIKKLVEEKNAIICNIDMIR